MFETWFYEAASFPFSFAVADVLGKGIPVFYTVTILWLLGHLAVSTDVMKFQQ